LNSFSFGGEGGYKYWSCPLSFKGEGWGEVRKVKKREI